MPVEEPPSGGLADLGKSGTPVSSRIADPDHALKICKRFVTDDRMRAERRRKVQGSFNGNAPKDPADLKRAGRETDSNLNFKRLRALIMEAWASLFQMVCEVSVCIDGKLNLGDSTQDSTLMRGFAKEEGLAGLFTHLRRQVPAKTNAGRGVRCPFCLSIHFAALITAALWWLGEVPTSLAPIYALAISGASVFIHVWQAD